MTVMECQGDTGTDEAAEFVGMRPRVVGPDPIRQAAPTTAGIAGAPHRNAAVPTRVLAEALAEVEATAGAIEVGGRPLAVVGDLPAAVVRLPLRYGNEIVGTLVVPAAGHRPQALRTVAPRLAAAVRAHADAEPAFVHVAVEGGLAAALARVAGGARVEVWPLPALAPHTEGAAYLIAAEALANAARHAPGAPATVRVRVRGPFLEVRVTDEGPGLPRGFTAGTGVPAMRRWAVAAGGRCMVRRSVSGTLVEAMLPLGPVIPLPR